MSLIGFIGIIIVAAGIVFFLVAYFVLAPKNRWFTFTKEGTAKIIVRGDGFKKALIQWADRTFRYRTEQIEGDERWEVVEGKEPRHPFGGFRLYSVVHPLDDVFIYRFKWTHLHEDGTIKAHDEWLDYVFLKEDLYVLEIPLVEKGRKGKEGEEGAEDINGMPIGIKFVIPARIVNVYIAIFRVRRWLPMISGIVLAKARRFFAQYRYKEDLLNLRAGAGIEEVQRKAGVPEDKLAHVGDDIWEKFWQELEVAFLQAEAKKPSSGKLQIYGVELNRDRAGILGIDPSEDYRKLTTIEYETEQNKKKIIIEAEAEKARLATVAQGEQTRIKAVYSQIAEFGDLGKLIRALEAVEKSPLAASLTVQAIPGLQEVLRGVFGKPPEAINSQEISDLRKEIEELKQRKEKGG